MQCRNCQYQIPVGVAYCPNCGQPAPYSSGPPSQPGSMAPTVAAPFSPSYPPVLPTMAAPSSPNYPPVTPPNPYNVPPTTYGAGMSAPPPPANPYGIQQASPYDGVQQGALYGAPPIPPPYQPPQPRKSGAGVIVTVIILIVICVGSIAAGVVYFSRNATNTISNSNATATAALNQLNTQVGNVGATATAVAQQAATTPTDTSTPTGGATPSTSDISPAASQIITGAETTSTIDSNYLPTHPTSTFNSGATIYVTFKLAGRTGYLQAKWYYNGQLAYTNQILAAKPSNDHGYFGVSVSGTGDGEVAIYWCSRSNCSDAALGSLTTFTVS